MSVKEILGQELKAQGLEITEEMAIKAFKAVMATAPKILKETPNKLDDLLIPVLPLIEGKVIDLLDKIDGKDNN